MQRREFSQAALAAGALAALGPLTVSREAQAAVARAAAGMPAMGTNLSGMEWAKPGLRANTSSAPNLHFTVPRKADVAYLAACGFIKNRLPIQWELLQPMLHDTVANAAAKAAIGNPGAFHAGYEAFITGVLDAHAAAGTRCIIDNHNYGRYQDFRFQPDGSVTGLTVPPAPLRPYTTDGVQIQSRIFSLAPGATLKIANFTDFWTRAATKWKNHPGFGGYGLMNEPHDMPKPGGVIASNEEAVKGGEDLTIWPTFAQAAIQAIRAVDTVNPIYVAGNLYDSAMYIGTKNPGFPLSGANLVYEVHMYLDAFSNGAFFDYDTEVAKNYSAGFGTGAIQVSTGADRLKIAVDWAKAKGVKLALTEVGMPIDDPRWEAMFAQAAVYAVQSGCEVFTWMGGNHWPIRNYAINHVPGWHQNKTLEPAVSGVLKAASGIVQATLYDDGPGYAPAGTPLTITVYARGNLAQPVVLTVASNKGGTLSKSRLTIPAGANGQDSFTYTPAANQVATLSYTSDGQLSGQVPPPRKVFSLSDPVAYAATSLADAALAIVAKYGACKWELADGYTDYLLGAPAAAGQVVRAVSDSGYGSSPGNAMEMINWMNKDGGAAGPMSVPVMRVTNGKKNSDHSVPESFGFWCKKSGRVAGVQPNPRNRVPYNLEDAHFAIAALSVPAPTNTGVVFQASKTEDPQTSELGFLNGQPRARWIDSKGQTVQLLAPSRLAVSTPAVLALASVPGAQKLRLNSAEIGSAAATFAPSAFTQMLMGCGYISYYPREGFRGNLYAVIAGKGAPTAAELAVLERYLASTAGMTL
ncbi:cellulase family glycosylhydrolase [Polaromonas sp. JS666]|uniref:cellulase family glycosylhydrolase n=1 Tax=Polaromonas sp. (strain JS666 / ATCC BAA-500) TaxID=296591 RepID=UPI00088D75BF|nr:cellulase family glycosylhydrolase [Polaromonas sp. JS666]SDN26984.1 Aryl-phospho-beta-D-glucosidase BglC, GH1 family [Polaromonas sp. JS666]